MEQEKKITPKAAKILLYLTALTPVMLASKFIFPYIVVRTVFFRSLIELGLIALIWLIIKGEAKINFASLKKNYFFLIFGALILIELFAAALGESFAASFWSDLERMWGIFTALHIFFFYFLLRSFFGEREWRIFFHFSFAVSLLASAYGIVQRFPYIFKIYLFEAGAGRITGTFGNPTYVAIYLIFNLAFAAYFFIREKNWKLRIFYGAVIALGVFAFSLTEIRGAYLAVLAGLAVAGIVYLFAGGGRKAKISAVSAMAVVLAAGLLVFLNPESRLVAKIPFLSRLSTISLSATTAQTRFMGWKAAWEGFKEDPLTGAGMENYNIIFNKHLKASYYNLASSETYFDRAHNQFLNILAESGIFALLAYFAFPFFIFWYGIRGRRRGIFGPAELALFFAVAAAYYVHMFFVFEEIHSLMFFAITIAFMEFLYYRERLVDFDLKENKTSGKAKAGLIAILILAVFSLYGWNLRILRAAHLAALAYMSDSAEETINYYNRVLDMSIAPEENILTNYTDYLGSISGLFEKMKANDKQSKMLEDSFARLEAGWEKEIKSKPNDAFYHLKLGALRNLEFWFYDKPEYALSAEDAFKKGIELSPERLQLYYLLAENYVISGRASQAVVLLRDAMKLNPDFSANYYYLGRAYLEAGDLDKAYDYIVNEAIKKRYYGPENTNVLVSLATKLADRKDYDRLIDVYKRILKFGSNKPDVLVALAVAYVQTDRYDEARIAAERAAAIDSSIKAETDLFVRFLDEGKYEQLKEMTK